MIDKEFLKVFFCNIASRGPEEIFQNNEVFETVITSSLAGSVVFVEEYEFDGRYPSNLVGLQHSDGTYT